MSPKFPGKAVTLLYVKLMVWYSSLKLPLLCWRTQTWTPNFGLNCRDQPVSPGNHSISSSSSYWRPRVHCFVPPVSEDSVATDQKPKQGGKRGSVKHCTIYPSACTHPEDTVPVQQSLPKTFSIAHCSTRSSAFLGWNLETTCLL